LSVDFIPPQTPATLMKNKGAEERVRKRARAIGLAAMIVGTMGVSGCVLTSLWRSSALEQCDRDYAPGPARMDCYDRVEREAAKNR